MTIPRFVEGLTEETRRRADPFPAAFVPDPR